MKLPFVEQAVVPDAKITRYLLNPAHRDGASKARFFLGHGFRTDDPDAFRRALLAMAATSEMDAVPGRGGTKYVGTGMVTAPDGATLRIVSVWVLDDDQPPPRLVTAYPAGRHVR